MDLLQKRNRAESKVNRLKERIDDIKYELQNAEEDLNSAELYAKQTYIDWFVKLDETHQQLERNIKEGK